MLSRVLAAALIGAACLAPAPPHAQNERPSARYQGCRAAEDVDRRLEGICETIDEIHRRLDAARGQPRRRADIQYAHAMALLTIGDLGDDLALRDCIEASRDSATFYTRQRAPTRWAVLQLNIGNAMIALASREDEPARNESVPTVIAAIEAIDRAAQPDLWASAHETLADAYIVQGRGADPHALRQAATALRSALEVYRRPSFADRRERAQRRLEEIYRALGEEPEAA